MKLLDFASLMVRRPAEAFGRLEGIMDFRLEPFLISTPEYSADQLERIVPNLEKVLSIDLNCYFTEQGLLEIRHEVEEAITKLPASAPFPQINNGDFGLAKLCYSLCRAMRPTLILETGVCYGVTTAFILKAVQLNEWGTLHSIDLPPLGRRADDFVGVLVPELLRNNWQFHRGATKTVLPKLLNEIEPVNLFVHDSLHTYRNMKRELQTVTPYLSRPAVVISDDIDGNPAFSEWAANVTPEYWRAVHEEAKNSLTGIAVVTNSSSVIESGQRDIPAQQNGRVENRARARLENL